MTLYNGGGGVGDHDFVQQGVGDHDFVQRGGGG